MSEMTADAMRKAMSDGFEDAMKKMEMDNMGKKGNMDAMAMKKAFGDAMTDAMKPYMDGMMKMKDSLDARHKAEDEDKARRAADEAKLKAEDAAKDFEKQIVAQERARYDIMLDAMPLIDEAKRETLKGADVKDILIAALGDSIPNAANQSVDYLRGALDAAKHSASLGGVDDMSLPAGVVAFDSRPIAATDARKKAQDAYIQKVADQYTKAGGK